jgi:hypothetical protein
LETLDQYAAGYEEEAIRRFLAGKPPDPGFIGLWLERVAAATGAGRQMQRVHVVTEPLSDYLRYEMDGYRLTVAAGEDAGILPRSVARQLELPGEEPDVVARYCRWRDVALEAATPYARYVVELQARRPPDDWWPGDRPLRLTRRPATGAAGRWWR